MSNKECAKGVEAPSSSLFSPKPKKPVNLELPPFFFSSIVTGNLVIAMKPGEEDSAMSAPLMLKVSLYIETLPIADAFCKYTRL